MGSTRSEANEAEQGFSCNPRQSARVTDFFELASFLAALAPRG
jgi:hypothetical protein